MTKVVAFGAFVEILPGVEGLVHISELADHHVENPSEVVEPGAVLNVKILEIDEERRRLSLSIKRVEGQNMPLKDLGAAVQEAQAATVDPAPTETPDLDLSEEVFAEPPPEPPRRRPQPSRRGEDAAPAGRGERRAAAEEPEASGARPSAATAAESEPQPRRRTRRRRPRARRGERR